MKKYLRFFTVFIITLALILSMVLLSGCHYQYLDYTTTGGAIYALHPSEKYYCVISVGSDNEGDIPVVYLLPEIFGIPVLQLGKDGQTAGFVAYFEDPEVERIYVSWTTEADYEELYVDKDTYLFFPNMNDKVKSNIATVVIPNGAANNYTEVINNGGYILANIAYIFNYEDNPNEGYFFIDLIEETGKLTKPPYDPKREGYTFDGWYKDEGCTEEWSFEEDEVIISFDEEGNRIYEEIKLYAKWKSE